MGGTEAINDSTELHGTIAPRLSRAAEPGLPKFDTGGWLALGPRTHR